MEFRFRYRGPQGAEVEVASLEGLRTLVQSGAVGELTLMYDALTREWAPARAHAAYWFARDELSSAQAAPGAAPPPSSEKRPARGRGPASSPAEPGADDLLSL